MQVNLGKLFESVKIGPVEIKNRVAMAPMGVVGLVNADGSLNARGIDYYIERARGGVGLIREGDVGSEATCRIPRLAECQESSL